MKMHCALSAPHEARWQALYRALHARVPRLFAANIKTHGALTAAKHAADHHFAFLYLLMLSQSIYAKRNAQLLEL